MRIKYCFYSWLFVAVLSLVGCGGTTLKSSGSNGGETPPVVENPPINPPVILTPEVLKNQYGFKIPAGQATGDVLPSQPGTVVQGITVKGGPGKDTNWTAFTLVIHVDDSSSEPKYRVLIQKRSDNGTLEIPGGASYRWPDLAGRRGGRT